MAKSAVSSVAEHHVVDKEYCCSICEEHNTEINAVFYCKKCNKFFCGQCIHSHSKHVLWFNKPYGKDEIMKWPLSKKMENYLLACDIHKNEKLTKFCQDHSRLCCSKCVDLDNRLCLQVTPIPQAATFTPTDFKNLSVRTQGTLSQIQQFQTYQEGRMKSLKASYKEFDKDMVEDMRLNITSFLFHSENGTMNETHEHVQYTVIEMREQITSLLAVFEKSTIKEKKKELTLKQAPLKSVRNSCIRLQHELFQLHVAIQKVLGRLELSFIASIKCQAKIQQSETFLNENFPNHVLTVQGKSEYNYVRIPSDSDTCHITGCCVLPDGQVLVADMNNKKVKLLNQQYQVVSHWGVTGYLEDMCMITPSEVAAAVDDYRNTPKVQFITVNQSQLVPGRKLRLQHCCNSIAHHQGDLFITSNTALHKYSLSGKLVCRLYEDVSGDLTVWKCAVSPTGDRLYITSYWQNSHLTLARDGTLLATFTDLELGIPEGVHVTPAGQVLVCGRQSNTIVQVDREGKEN